jgi:RNA polymerase sigma-70 factor (ECF subfamily)
MSVTDEILVERFIKTGDVEAYAEIIKLHSGMVYAVCSRILRDRTRAEDVCQETFLQLLRKADTVKGSLSCWLHATATWKAIDVIRQDSSRKERESAYTVDKTQEASTWEEISPTIDQALAELPEREKRLLVEHFLEGKSTSSLAEELGMSQPTVSRKIGTSLKHVRKHLEKKGIVVGSAVLLSVFSNNMVEAASQHLIEELGKMTILAGAKAAVSQTVVTLKILKITLGTLIVGIALGFLFFSFNRSPSRSDLRSIHYMMQSRDNGPNAGSLSKGAYERWYYFPEGADGPMMMRVQRWDPKVTAKLCSWLQNAEGNYYYHAGEKRLYITNYRLWQRDLGIRTLPTDTQDMVSKLEKMNGLTAGVDFVRDPTTGYLKSAIDHRFSEAPEFETIFEYDALREDFFNYNWASNVEVVDERDAIHRQGWTYFYVEGQIGEEKVSGTGRLPLIYREIKDHYAWLDMKIGVKRRIIDCADGALIEATEGKMIPFPKGYFFRGLSRPWMGMHTIDIIRRDAIQNGMEIKTHAIDEEEKEVEVTLLDKQDYTRTQIMYRIDMERDLIESISFLDDRGNGRAKEGFIRFIYFDKNSRPASEFIEPTITQGGREISQLNSGAFWLLDFAKGKFN